MKKLFLKSLLLLSALIVGTGNVWAAEEVYKTLTFCNAGTSSDKTQDYTSSWSETISGFTWAIANFNNNQWGWNDGGDPVLYIVKCGRKKGSGNYTPSVATITTNAAIDKAITKVVVTLTAISANDYNSIKLYIASTSAFDEDNDDYFETITVSPIPTSAGNMTIAIPEAKRAASRYYKIEFDTKGSTSSNGHTGLKKVEYYIDAATAPTFSLDAGSYSGTQSVELSCATDGASIYYTTDGTTPTTSSTLYSSAISVTETTTIKAIAVKAGLENSSVSSATYTITSDPIITLGSSSVAATTAETDGSINVTYNNLTNYDAEIYWFASDGTTPATYDWVDAEINASTKHLDYTIAENTSTSSRTAYLKVYALGDEGDVYSSLITITQAGVDFVTLPFSYTSGKADIATTTGISQSGLGSDYSSSAILKFDNAEDYVIVKTNAPISSLYYDIKGNSFSGGTFKVQTSANGVDYSDLKSYSSFTGSVEIERFTSINSAVRYIKWIYTSRSSGNVGMGNIHIDCEPVTVSTACYSTYASASALDFTDKAIKAYVIESTNASYVTLTQVYKVPANTAVVLYKDGGTTESIPVFDGTGADDVSENLLEVSDGNVTGDGSTIYALSVGKEGGEHEGEVGFFKVKSGVKVPAGKAYLTITGGGAPAVLHFVEDGQNTTALDNIDTNDQAVKFFENGNLYILRDGITYDVTGRIVK